MSTSTSIYLLLDGDENETKTWYPLSLDYEDEMNFFSFENRYKIAKSDSSCPAVISIYKSIYIFFIKLKR